MPAPKLRAVDGTDSVPSTTEIPVPKRRSSITEAAESGNARDLLVAMRERVAKAVENPNCPPRDLAALTRRLQEIGREIEAIDAKVALEAGEDVAGDEEWDASAI